jgi:hypothetical protein
VYAQLKCKPYSVSTQFPLRKRPKNAIWVAVFRLKDSFARVFAVILEVFRHAQSVEKTNKNRRRNQISDVQSRNGSIFEQSGQLWELVGIQN